MRPLAILFTGLIAGGMLSGCKRGFELDENTVIDEENADEVLVGSDSGASWRLLLDEDEDSFTIENKAQPSSENTKYTLNGNYTRLNSGWLEYTISTSLPSEISQNTFYGVELGNAATVFFPFVNNRDEWLIMVNTDGCSSNDTRGNAILLDRTSDASQTDVEWLGNYVYDESEESAELDNGLALDENFTEQSALTIDSDNCDDGIVEISSGDHYLGKRAHVLEIDDDVIADGNTRLLSLPARNINALSDIDSSDYIGMLRIFSAPEDQYRATANCVAGSCDIFIGDGSTTPSDADKRFTLSFEDDNRNFRSVDGLITAKFDDTDDSTAQTRAACMVNTDIDTTSATVRAFVCTAQSPSDNTKTVQLLFSARS